MLTACQGAPVTRQLEDSSAPGFMLTVTAAKSEESGLLTVPFGQDVELAMPGGSIVVEAADPGGVGWVELWMEVAVTCPVGDDLGQLQHPGLADPRALARAEGEVTETQAPRSLSVAHDINTMELQPGCVYEFRVHGEAANAATTAVTSRSPASTLTLRT